MLFLLNITFQVIVYVNFLTTDNQSYALLARSVSLFLKKNLYNTIHVNEKCFFISVVEFKLYNKHICSYE